MLYAASQGIVSGKFTLADVLFLVGAILFFLGLVIAVQVKTYYAALIAAGLTVVAVGWLVL